MEKPVPACAGIQFPLFLVGYMGSGKTTLGKGLADHCGVPFMDLDREIERRWGQTIAQGVAKQGELAFRKWEHSSFEELIPHAQGVVAVGGGTPMYYNHMDQLLERGTVVFVDPPFGELVNRLRADRAARPLIAHLSDEDLPGFVGAHLLERRATYHRAQVHYAAVQEGVEGLIRVLRAYFSARADR